MVRFGRFKLLRSWWYDARTVDEDGNWKEDTNPKFLIDTTVRSGSGWDLLAFACHFGHISIIKTLLRAGMKANERNKYDESPFYGALPLTLASKQGHVEICKFLIEREGCDPNFPVDLGNPLYCAAERSHLEVLRYLLSAGADPSSPIQLRRENFNHPGSALVAAAYNNNVEALQILVKEGNADPKMLLPEDYHLGSAAIAAAFQHSIDTLKYLILEEHVDANAEITTGLFGSVLIAAAAHRRMSLEILRCLGQHGVNFNTRLRERNGSHVHLKVDDPGTVLEKAVIKGLLLKGKWVLRVLVEECKVDVNHLSEDGPYGCALAAAQDHCLQPSSLFKHLIDGRHHARKNSWWLVESGANVNLQLPHGRYHSPLAAVAALSSRRMIEYLIDEGADTNLELQYGDYGSALAFAAAGDYLESAQCLIDRGADVNLHLTHGKYRNALMGAAGVGNEDAVRFLINKGADVNQPENFNWEELLLMEEELVRNRRILLPSSSSRRKIRKGKKRRMNWVGGGEKSDNI